MSRSKLTYYLMLAAAILLYIWVDSQGSEKPKIDWSESFSRDEKSPYGAFILHERLTDLFPESEISETRLSIREKLEEDWQFDHNYIIINSDFEASESDVDWILDFVRYGGNAFIAARFFPETFEDSLGFQTSLVGMGFHDTDSVEALFLDPEIENRGGFDLDETYLADHFTAVDTLITEVLSQNNQRHPNLVRIPWGDGFFVLSTVPSLMTNYYLLDETNFRYASHALSYLPQEYDVLWDEHYKVKRLAEQQSSRHPLQFINSQPPLKYAFWLILASALLYVVFEMKRTQRIIPIQKPLPNDTLDFTETVGELYYQGKNHNSIVEKKIRIFLEFIRSHYFLKTHSFDDEFLRAVSGKSGVPLPEVKDLFRTLKRAQLNPSIEENELIELNHKIESFHFQTRNS